MEVKKGPWTPEEDSVLFNHITQHGEGHWNSVARLTGLKRTGKSCRLRWLNYLRPNVRRGNISLQEQLLILQLHSRWGNRWSKIAEFLPGRTDNEIKNYWRTRVQKQAKHLNCDVNSQRFRDAMTFVWIPRLLERIRATSGHSPESSVSVAAEPMWVNPTVLPDRPATSSDSSVTELEGGEQYGSGGWGPDEGELESGWLESLWTEENMRFLRQQLSD